MRHISQIIQDSTGYYAREFSYEDFEGQVMHFKGNELNIFFQRYWDGTEEAFREWLQRRDDWYTTVGHHIQKNWLNQTVKRLEKIATKKV